MAEVKKARLFLRRGTDTDRKVTVLCEGELGYSTDAFRLFVGDGSTAGGRTLGITTHVSAQSAFYTTLTEASANGLAHTGDVAIFPSHPYTNGGGATVAMHPTHASTVLILTGSDASDSAHWTYVNKNIPFGNISVSADDISGNYVSGGSISAPIAISGGDIHIGGADTENLYLSGVALDAQKVPTGDIIYPLGVTSTSEVTCISSIFGFGSQTSSGGGNALGFLSGGDGTNGAILSAYKYGGNAASKSTGGTAGSLVTSNNIFSYYLNDGAAAPRYFPGVFPTNFDSDGEKIQYQPITYNITDINNSVMGGSGSLVWSQIEEFHFSLFGFLGESKASFFGYHNAQIGANIPLDFVVTNAKKKKINSGPRLTFARIPNTYNQNLGTAGEILTIHLGNCPTGFSGLVFTGVKIKA